LDTTQKKIKSETLNLSGIYLILNKITLDYYIGSASTNRFYARFSNHLFNFHGSKIVKAAVRKYKISQFAFINLDLFPLPLPLLPVRFYSYLPLPRGAICFPRC